MKKAAERNTQVHQTVTKVITMIQVKVSLILRAVLDIKNKKCPMQRLLVQNVGLRSHLQEREMSLKVVEEIGEIKNKSTLICF